MRPLEQEHGYGSHIHLLASTFYQTVLARFSMASGVQPAISEMVREMAKALLASCADQLFLKARQKIQTRMHPVHPEAEFDLELIDPQQKIVVVDLMRAGILPAQTIYEFLHLVFPAQNLRQDHILLNRKTNADEKVIGVHMSGHKIGGPIEDAYVLIPDPMGATGSTIENILQLYETLKLGKPKKFIALHFIVTPEYLRRLKPFQDRLEVFALRLDRGLSGKAVLQKKLGEAWNDEKGLNEKQYIIPGAGGIGEILNNSFV